MKMARFWELCIEMFVSLKWEKIKGGILNFRPRDREIFKLWVKMYGYTYIRYLSYITFKILVNSQK